MARSRYRTASGNIVLYAQVAAVIERHQVAKSTKKNLSRIARDTASRTTSRAKAADTVCNTCATPANRSRERRAL
jgi:hypothetical protein